MVRARAVLALLVFADGTLAFNMPSVMPARIATAHYRPAAGLRGPTSGRRGALAPRMSFIPADKKTIEENFSKIPDHIVLRDPVELNDVSTQETATIYGNGACLTSYVSGGYDVLFRRPDAVFDGSKPISGGVPICWPQFGPGDMQQHGFARNLKWECVDVRAETANGMNQGSWLSDQNRAVFELMSNAETRKMWDRKFKARYEVKLEGGAVSISMRVENKGWETFDFTCALHTYFAVDDIDACSISGLKDKTYVDKTVTPAATKTETDAEFKVNGAPVERIYADVTGPVVLKDGAKKVIIKADSKWKDVVLWNPYGNDAMGYKNFICIETGCINEPVTLRGGEMWYASVTYTPYKDGMPSWAAGLADDLD